MDGKPSKSFPWGHSAYPHASIADKKLIIVERFVEEHSAGLFRKGDQSLQLMDVLS